jgi:hypothetical protein
MMNKLASYSAHLFLLFFLELDDLIVTHGRQNNNHVRLVLSRTSLEGGGNFTSKAIGPLRELDVLTGGTFSVHEGDESIGGDVKQRVFLAGNERNISVVGGRDDIFVLLAVEDIDGGEVALGVTVLASLGGGDMGHLARVSLDADVSAYSDLTGFFVVDVGSSSVSLGKVIIIKISHFC